MPEDHSAKTRTACSYCGVGCGVVVETKSDPASGRQLIAKVSGDKLHPTNAGRLCTKGATHADLMNAGGRMETAFVRTQRDADRVPAPVDTAVKEAATRLRKILDEHGPDAIALYVSGQMSIEAQYLANKLAKGFLRTIHIESNSRLCMASAGTGYKQSLGADGPPGSYADFDRADVFFVIGSNMADCHPILFLRMADRLKLGAKLIVVDPRRTTTAERADLFLQIKAGTDLALLNGILHLLIENGWIDQEFIAEHTAGWDAMPAFLADYTPDRVAEITGLAPADIRTAAQWIGESGNWMSCWTMGLNQSTHGTWNTNAICNLHLATGAICRPGSGPMSLTGQPNAMGGREMGYMGPGLPGQRSVASDKDREFVEQAWGLAAGSIRTDIGPGTVEMFSMLAAGEIKACWIICTNPVATVPNRKTVIAGLEAAELVITQDAYTDTATNAYADIMLPATMWAESDAVMVNSERNLTLLAQAIEPAGDARPDWLLIAQVATEMGFGDDFAYTSSAEIFDEIRRFANPKTGYDLRGITYDRLRENPVQWPSPPGDKVDRHPIRYLNDGVSQDLFVDDSGFTPRLAFATPTRRANFFARPHMEPFELPDDEYPWVLNTGRLQHQWHTMTKTGKVAKLNKLNPGPFVEINPEDAERLGLVEGDDIEVASRRGRAVLPAVVTDRVQPGSCFAPFHWNDEHGEYVTINAVTSDAVDAESLQPEFKVCAVTLRRVAKIRSATGVDTTPQRVPVQDPIAAALGIDLSSPPVLADAEKLYLGGFLKALHITPPDSVPVLPAGAPVSRGTKLWVDGMLAGTYSRVPQWTGSVDLAERVVAEDAREVVVLWASQTGNAEECANQCAIELESKGFAPRLLDMDTSELDELVSASEILVITSTFGDGGPPDNGADFWTRLSAADAPRMAGTRYAVFAMGDSSYDDFCGHGRAVDTRFSALGATPILPRVDSEPDFEEPFRDWLDDVMKALGQTTTERPLTPVRRPGSTALKPLFTRTAPVQARLARNEVLTGAGSAKEVRQFGFDISEFGVSYDAGDALGVYPVNHPAAVQGWLRSTRLDPARSVTVGNDEMALGDALRERYDICRITPDLLRFIADRNSDPQFAKLLRRDNKNELDKFLWGRQAVDLLADYPIDADLVEWQSVLKPLQPRQYSISSSPLVSPDEVQLTVSVVRFGRDDLGGVCSTFLADRGHEGTVPVYLQRAPHFCPPMDPSTPMIMIGPGTGIAPFRGFLQERRELGASGQNWLFFGEQHKATNFYYRSELENMFRDGFLTRLDLAFSRDQRERIYVQDRMIEHGAELWRWLESGAHLYVCGDAARMAKDVDNTLLKIAQIHGKMSEDEALAYKKKLTTDKRYVRDVY
ncbi:bifunctional nitrate reductase/sulfite reductase flavoprotein subunit alpha [Antrihabitans sp. YC2-6]|uniref:bifunctional nitrate reductase/sulfite reductase flavoprotein subunit alpha n=1 Tax=Antrihabitans sp. YC2-6 TaxID=2799498 RepID=UPI0018F3E6E8|nr:bifunctional nitrate reductase/sulfite reductase flavoprotein subunit alpha [Antrihabitans sp. YC2-6]MBJ8348611.1 molybdopterin-dependent oxidoreductase [Antrihabitans sp. YC2-6]